MQAIDKKTALGEIDNILGTPSSQKIIRLLVSWNLLSIKDIMEKSGLSESQTHATIKQLKQISLIMNQSRGIYKFADNKFAKQIQEAYYTSTIEIINWRISTIKKLLKEDKYQQAKVDYALLHQQYQPLLRLHFRLHMDSLAKRMLESVN